MAGKLVRRSESRQRPSRARTANSGRISAATVLGLSLVFSGSMPWPNAEASRRADCVQLKGAADALFDQKTLCRDLKEQTTKSLQPPAEHPDRAVRSQPEKPESTQPRVAAKPEAQAQRRKSRRPAREPRRPPLRSDQPQSQRGTSHDVPLTRPEAPDVAFSPSQPSGRPSPIGTPTSAQRAAPTISPRPSAGIQVGSEIPRGTLPTLIVILLLLALFVIQQVFWPLTAPGIRDRPRERLRIRRGSGSRGERDPTAAPAAAAQTPAPTDLSKASPVPLAQAGDLAWKLAQASGMGVIGTGANAFMRTALVETLVQSTGSLRVLITRNELNRIFEGDLDESLQEDLVPQLQVYELLEEVIEHLEAELDLAAFLGEAERANPDLASRASGERPATLWICTPGQDHDVVYPLVVRGPDHRLTAVMFGDWPHGSTFTLESDGSAVQLTRPDGMTLTIETRTAAEAIAALRTYAATTKGNRS